MSHDARVPGPDEQGPVLSSVLRSSLRCPLSGQELADGVDDTGHPGLISPAVGLAYPVRVGVPTLPVPDALRAPARF